MFSLSLKSGKYLEIETSFSAAVAVCSTYRTPEMEKAADAADMSVLFFLAGANF